MTSPGRYLRHSKISLLEPVGQPTIEARVFVFSAGLIECVQEAKAEPLKAIPLANVPGK